MTDMKIISISITEFGGLKDFQMSFSDGLNIIRGDNEAGKSTVLLFITYMLYGLSKKTSKNNDKERSLSWSGSRAEGSMEIEHRGRKYRIERANVRRTMGSEAVITDMDTGVRVHAGEEPGAVFLGLSKEAFESCVWCGQARVSSINGEGVAATLSNLSLTADESINGDAVLKAIREARKQYRYERGNGGLIYESEQAKTEAELKVRELESISTDNIVKKEKVRELEAQEKQAREATEAAKELKRSAATTRILIRIKQLQGLKKEIEDDGKALNDPERRKRFSGKDPDGIELAAVSHLKQELREKTDKYNLAAARSAALTGSDARAVSIAKKISVRESGDAMCERIASSLSLVSRGRLGAMICAVSAVACVAGAILGRKTPLLYALIAAAVAFIGVSATLWFISLRKRREVRRELYEIGTDEEEYRDFIGYCFDQLKRYDADRARAERIARDIEIALEGKRAVEESVKAKLDEYGRETDNGLMSEISALLGDICDYVEWKGELIEKIKVNSGVAEREARLLEGYDEQKLRDSLPEGIDEDTYIDEKQASAEVSAAAARYESVRAELSDLRLQLASSGEDEEKLAELYDSIEKSRNDVATYTARFEALDRAYSAVREAYENMKRNFAPKVRESAGEYLEGISSGRYSKVLLSESMGVSVDASGKERSADNLSGGTSDAVYISLRFALVKQIFEGTVPFFMDETLSRLDDRRASGVLELTRRFTSQGNQCLLFSCHNREASLCDKMGIGYNKIEM